MFCFVFIFAICNYSAPCFGFTLEGLLLNICSRYEPWSGPVWKATMDVSLTLTFLSLQKSNFKKWKKTNTTNLKSPLETY